MKNSQLKAGYNLQLGVEGEYIVGAYICAERSDELALLGLLEAMDEGCKVRHKEIVADAGYESEENYNKLAERGQIAYIKPQNYERSKTRKYRNNAFLRDNMPYNAQRDTYTCPVGKQFAKIYETTRKSKSGFTSHVTVYECESCQGCPQKVLCTRTKGNRRIWCAETGLWPAAFFTEGKDGVFTEVLLYALAYNINKLHNKMRQNKRGCTIYLLDSA